MFGYIGLDYQTETRIKQIENTIKSTNKIPDQDLTKLVTKIIKKIT